MQMQMQKCISCRKAELLLCVEVEEIRVWIVEFGLSEAHCGGFSKSRENSLRPDVIHRHSSDVRR